ncbi:MAG: PqqD family protein [Abitibacteriaceae bacterium]|nr:PqqD family protein [Abditibacteriaceae bacterium]
MFANNSRVVAADKSQVVACDLEGEVALLNLHNQTYYSLDPIGAYIWRRLDNPQSVADLLQSLLQEYAVEAEPCQQDLLRLLERLHEAGLIIVLPDS